MSAGCWRSCAPATGCSSSSPRTSRAPWPPERRSNSRHNLLHVPYATARPHRYDIVPFDPLHHPGLLNAGRRQLDVILAVMRGYDIDGPDAIHAIRCARTIAHGFASIESNGAWVSSHLFAMIGFILVPIGFFALRNIVSATRAERPAFAALLTAWLGAGLTLPYYGGEDFALHAAATTLPAEQVMPLADAFRMDTTAVTTFALGLGLLGVSAILAAIAVWRSGVLPRTSGLALALGFAVYIPQFYTTPAIRMAHGAVLAIGGIWLAVAMWRAGSKA